MNEGFTEISHKDYKVLSPADFLSGIQMEISVEFWKEYDEVVADYIKQMEGAE